MATAISAQGRFPAQRSTRLSWLRYGAEDLRFTTSRLCRAKQTCYRTLLEDSRQACPGELRDAQGLLYPVWEHHTGRRFSQCGYKVRQGTWMKCHTTLLGAQTSAKQSNKVGRAGGCSGTVRGAVVATPSTQWMGRFASAEHRRHHGLANVWDGIQHRGLRVLVRLVRSQGWATTLASSRRAF